MNDLIELTLRSLYMPSNIKQMMIDEFVSPVMCFLVLRALGDGGHFRDPKLLTSPMVQVQFNIRLVVLMFVLFRVGNMNEVTEASNWNWFE